MKKYFFLFALVLVVKIQGFAQQKMESLKILWPEEYQWKLAVTQENENTHFMQVIPGKDSVDNWSMIGTMMSGKGIQKISVERMMKAIYTQTQNAADDVKLTVVEKSPAKAAHEWILFKLESPAYHSDKKPESQLYYILQGNTSLYTSSIALKESTLDEDFIKKWSEVFKSSELVYE